jgi:hypothetical protein
MSPVFLAMFETKMKETGDGVLEVKDIYTGSGDNLAGLKVEVVLELLNASVKV